MPMSITMLGKDEFFHKVLSPEGFMMYGHLLADGVKFTTELYTIKAEKGVKGWQVNLPVVVTTLLKTTASAQSELACNMVNEFVSKLYQVVLPEVTKPQEPTIHEAPIKTAAEFFEKAEDIKKEASEIEVSLGELLKKKLADAKTVAPIPDPVPVPPKAKILSDGKIKAGVIPLCDAEVVGQKVRGTSNGSVYIAVAVNPRVKLAARVKGSSISLRVECKDGVTEKEMDAIKGLLQWHGNYGSTHFEAGNIPVQRVLGAAIYGMGVQFDDVIKAGEALQSGI